MPDVTEFAPGDELLGTTGKRGSQAELALAAGSRRSRGRTRLPGRSPGGLWTVATTAYAAVRAVDPGSGDVVVVAGASGGVGGLAAQLARQRGATVIGVAGERSHAWLRSHGIEPLAYRRRPRRAASAPRPPAGRSRRLIDTVGSGYVDLAIELGIAAERIDTIADSGPRSESAPHRRRPGGVDRGGVAEFVALIADRQG